MCEQAGSGVLNAFQILRILDDEPYGTLFLPSSLDVVKAWIRVSAAGKVSEGRRRATRGKEAVLVMRLNMVAKLLYVFTSAAEQAVHPPYDSFYGCVYLSCL